MSTILVIENNDENRRILRDLLASADYQMVEAVTGEGGLSMAEAHHPAVALMDIQLPGLDGYEVTRRLKANPSLRRVPIIAVTSDTLAGDDARALAAGCDAYFAKPYDPLALLTKIREYVAPGSR